MQNDKTSEYIRSMSEAAANAIDRVELKISCDAFDREKFEEQTIALACALNAAAQVLADLADCYGMVKYSERENAALRRLPSEKFSAACCALQKLAE